MEKVSRGAPRLTEASEMLQLAQNKRLWHFLQVKGDSSTSFASLLLSCNQIDSFTSSISKSNGWILLVFCMQLVIEEKKELR